MNEYDKDYLYSLNLKEARNIFEYDYIMKNLNRFNGNISKTANFIGMERSAFHRKLNNMKQLKKSKVRGTSYEYNYLWSRRSWL